MPFKAVKLYSPAGNADKLLNLTGQPDINSALTVLVQTLIRDSRFNHSVMVLRLYSPEEEYGGIYLFGDFPPEETERVSRLAAHILYTAENSRFIGYRKAEELAVLLADKLIRKYGREKLNSFEFRPVPRGGYIVCALLLYALGRVQASAAGSRPLMLVDDAVFSGHRILQTIESLGLTEKTREVSVAVLAAPEELCTEEAAGRQGFSIIAAEEYEDSGPEIFGRDYPIWKDRWEKKTAEKVLWTGYPEALVFAWSEPESIFINGVSGELEAGFRLYPPERCFRNRFEGNSENQFQIHGDSSFPWNAAPGVVAARLDENRIVVADFTAPHTEDSTDCFLLEGTAADMWDMLLRTDSIRGAAQRLSDLYDVDSDEILLDLENFARSLKKQGLLLNE